MPLYRRRFLIQNDKGEDETMSIFWGLMVERCDREDLDKEYFERVGIFDVFSDVWFDGVRRGKLLLYR